MSKKPAKTRPSANLKRTFWRGFNEGQRDIQCLTYEDDCKRRNKKDPKDGIATDSKDDEEWNDGCPYPDELAKPSHGEE